MRVGVGAAVFVLVALWPVSAWAQANFQLWGNVTIDWLHTARVTYEVDVEPKVLVAAPQGSPAWRNLDLTPSVAYAAKSWLDVSGEVATGYTRQTDNVNSFEVTPRFGLRFHVFSRSVPTRPHVRELPPKRRLVVRDFVRAESRNIIYTGDGSGSSSTVRFRNRLELLFPLNKQKVTDDGTRYALADWEWFIPLGDPDERFANKQRIRAGFGYRKSLQWRFEALYIWTRSRNTISEGFTTSDNIVDIRLKRVF